MAWREFKVGKIHKEDVSRFVIDVEEHLFALHENLKANIWVHGEYSAFNVRDPKLRHIHKASVVDRVLHHAIVRVLEPIFDKTFIFDSYSSRKTKGTHKAGERFRQFAWKLSRNNTKTVWVLKCDIRRFFDSVDHVILLELLQKKIRDEKTNQLLRAVITSFSVTPHKGIPIGNLTSQLFSNIYLNRFDHFVKRELRVKEYIRYADDFVIISSDQNYLENLIPVLQAWLAKHLKLELHSKKVSIQKWHRGIDFLGYVHWPYHTIMRTNTKQRMVRKTKEAHKKLRDEKISLYSFAQIVQSYLGRLKHCRSKVLQKYLANVSGTRLRSKV